MNPFKLNSLALLYALLMLVSNTFIVPAIAAPHAAAGLSINNKVIVTYKDNNGIAYTGESNIITITIRAVDSATLTNDSQP